MATVVQMHMAALAVGRIVSPSQWSFSSGPCELLCGLLSFFVSFAIPPSASLTLLVCPLLVSTIFSLFSFFPFSFFLSD